MFFYLGTHKGTHKLKISLIKKELIVVNKPKYEWLESTINNIIYIFKSSITKLRNKLNKEEIEYDEISSLLF